MANKFISTKNIGIFIGKINDNSKHKHYAIQVNISLGNEFILSTSSNTYKTNSCIIKPLHQHQLDSNSQDILLILISPASSLGHFIAHHLLNQNVEIIKNDWFLSLKSISQKWQNEEINTHEFLEQFDEVNQVFIHECKLTNHIPDDRILRSIEILEEHAESVMPLKSIANKVHLSPSRFIHLFKSETGISYRRMQLWIKLMKSFLLFKESVSLTSLAYTSGFSDSAHYARTFKETFGISPSNFKKMLMEE